MASFLTRRISFIMLVAVLIVFFTFIGMNMISNSERAAPNFSLLDHGDIAWDRTQDYFGALFHGNLGEATLGGVSLPIGEIIGQSYLNSMGLLLVALIGAAGFGLYFGTLAALIRFRRLVLPLLTITILGVSTPSFVAALILQLGELKYVEVFGRRLVSMGGFGWDYKHMLLPVLVLMARPLAYLTRATFIALRRIMEENYIRTAFAKGFIPSHNDQYPCVSKSCSPGSYGDRRFAAILVEFASNRRAILWMAWSGASIGAGH